MYNQKLLKTDTRVEEKLNRNELLTIIYTQTRKLKNFHSSFDYNKIKILTTTKHYTNSIRILPTGKIIGETLNHKTINQKTGVIEYGGLYCSRIYGPITNYTCACGKYIGISDTYTICEVCYGEVNEVKSRKYNISYIDLNTPICHLWYYVNIPNYFSVFLKYFSKEFENTFLIKELIYTDRNEYFLNSLYTYYQILKKNFLYVFLLKNIKIFKKKEVYFLNLFNKLILNKIFKKNLLFSDKLLTGSEFFNIIFENFKLTNYIFLIKNNLIQIFLDKKYNRNSVSDLLSTLRIIESFKVNKLDPNSMILNTFPIISPAFREFTVLNNGELFFDEMTQKYVDLVKSNTDFLINFNLLNILNFFLRQDIDYNVFYFIIFNIKKINFCSNKRLLELVLNYLFTIKYIISDSSTSLFTTYGYIQMKNKLFFYQRKIQQAIDEILYYKSLSYNSNFSNEKENLKQIKTLSESFKGKEGIFRQYLLGKRVNYSGRSVIVINPRIQLNNCGLPFLIAEQLLANFSQNFLRDLLFKKSYELIINPFSDKINFFIDLLIYIKRQSKFPAIKKIFLIKKYYIKVNKIFAILKSKLKEYKNKLNREKKKKNFTFFLIKNHILKNKNILLNRAPTLHKYGIQSFRPILVADKSIHLHPLVCLGYNADFDGDQMGIYLPYYGSSQVELQSLMQPNYNILSTSNGSLILKPAQDMVMGIYYLTLLTQKSFLQFKNWYSDDESVLMDFIKNKIYLHTKILVNYNLNLLQLYIKNDKIYLIDFFNNDKYEKELEIFHIFNRIYNTNFFTSDINSKICIKTHVKYFITNIGIFIVLKYFDYFISTFFFETTPGRIIFNTNFNQKTIYT